MNSATKATIVGDARSANQAALDRIRQHPFIVAAHAGALTADQGKRWVFCAGRESKSFPRIIEQMIPKCTIASVQEILRENLNDEHGNGNPEHAHFRHYLHLLGQMGIDRSEFESYREGPGITLALELAYNIAHQPSQGVALGYMLVNEGMTPITYEAARSILVPSFPGLPTTFFDLHIEVDEHHVNELYKALEALPCEELSDVLFGISVGERGMAVLLDEALGLFDYAARKLGSICAPHAGCGRECRAK